MTKIQLEPIIDFGKMPISNAFLTPDEFQNEYFFDLVLGFDPKTFAIGLVNKVPPEKMFHDHYAFYSSTSNGMQAHFKRTADKLLPYAGKGLVVEIGSNDGIMLEAWKQLKVHALGIEPSKNVAEASKKRGHQVINKFISNEVVKEILDLDQPVSLFFGANVSCHIENLTGYLKNVTELISKQGVFVFEDPYFLDIWEKTSYDQIYDEHIWYFTISFINKMLEPLGYHVFDCEHIEVHGGELRMYVGHKDTFSKTENVHHWLVKESNLEQKLYELHSNIKKSKIKLLEILDRINKDGKKICGFGATSKATTIFNYCGIGPGLIPFVTDNTPIKQGKFYPGAHIPVVPQEQFKDMDFAFLLAWNHLKEISESQKAFTAKGGRWITHVPGPRII